MASWRVAVIVVEEGGVSLWKTVPTFTCMMQ